MRQSNPLLFATLFLGSLGLVHTRFAAAQPVAKASFLAEGSFALPQAGVGSIERAVAIAWAPSDEIHVAGERGGVAVFDASGAPVRTYGGEVLLKAAALDIDAQGRAYVLDTDQKTVIVFAEGGEVVHRIGSGGNQAGELDRPLDVAVGPAGLVYVLDSGRKGVQVFSLDGTFVHDIMFPPDVSEPRALAVAPSGEVYVADKAAPTSLVRLPAITEALNTVGVPVRAGRVPVRGGTARDPIAVVATPTGAVAVGDQDSGGLWYVDGAGGPTAGSDDRLYGGSGSGRGSFRKLQDLDLAGQDQMVLLDRDGLKVERIRLILEEQRSAQEVLDYPVLLQRVQTGLDGGVLGSAVRADGHVWFAMADEDGRNLRVVEAEMVEGTGVFGDRVRSPKPVGGAHDFSAAVERAADVALNDTLLVVTERGENRFHVFDLRSDASIGSFGDNYSDDRRLKNPRGVALFSDGRIAIADNGNDRVAVFSADIATLLGTFPLMKAEGVVVSPQGRLLAWDEDGLRAGAFPLEGGALEPLSGSLSLGPLGAMATDGAGNLYALGHESSRVAILDASAERLLARVGAAEAVEDGDRLTVDVDGNIYTTDHRAGTTAVTRWGVDVPTVRSLQATWSPDGAELRWAAVPGSFVTGYVLEGAPERGGTWSVVEVTEATSTRVDDDSLSWYRVSPRTLTGAVGVASEEVPVLHLSAATAFAEQDWAEALRLADEALDIAQAGSVTVEAGVRSSLAWAAFVSAHESEDLEAAVAWKDVVGEDPGPGRAFEYNRRLAEIYLATGDAEAALASAQEAIGAAGSDPDRAEQVTALQHRVFESGWELGRWPEVVAAGEAILRSGATEADEEFRERLARAYLEAGTPDRALTLAQGSLAEGASGWTRRRLLILAFMASAALEDYPTALEYSDATGDSLPAAMFVEYQLTLSRVLTATDDLVGASGQLMHLLAEEQDVQVLSDPEVAQTVLHVYGAFIESGDAEGAALMLDSVAAAFPVELMTLRSRLLEDAVPVAAVASTRAVLGEGLQYFQDAMFRDAVRFFQAADELPDLSVDQRLIVKEVLASVFHSLGRLDDADEVYREVYEVAPAFDLDAHLLHVQEVYGVTIFTDEMTERFRGLRPIM